MAEHDLTDDELTDLFTKGKTHTIKDFVSKKKTVFSAKIKIDNVQDKETGEIKREQHLNFLQESDS